MEKIEFKTADQTNLESKNPGHESDHKLRFAIDAKAICEIIQKSNLSINTSDEDVKQIKDSIETYEKTSFSNKMWHVSDMLQDMLNVKNNIEYRKEKIAEITNFINGMNTAINIFLDGEDK
ncbi:MAG: hypothetical protein WAV11_01605 [Minisyncoccia bacterium]